MDEPIVFISYATPDKTIAGLACQALEQQHIPCWIAPRNVPLGGNAFSAIPAGIQGCTVLVLILSSNTSKSKHVSREVQLALDHSKVIIPFRTENIQPEDALNYLLTGVQWLDAFVGPVERHVKSLVECVEGILRVRAPEFVINPIRATPAHRSRPGWLLWGGVAAAVVALAAAGIAYMNKGPDDAAVRRAVSGRLAQSLNGRNILVGCDGCSPQQPHVNVQVTQGQVAISGDVASPADVATVEAVPLNLAGVKGVSYVVLPIPSAAPTPMQRVATSAPQPRVNQPSQSPQAIVEPARAPAPEPALTAEQLRAKAYVMTGQAKMRAQDYISAENNFQAALGLDPDNVAARRGYEAAKKALGD